MIFTGLEITDVQSYVDDDGRLANIITAERGGSRIRFTRVCANDQEADKIIPGMKINFSVFFHDELGLLI